MLKTYKLSSRADKKIKAAELSAALLNYGSLKSDIAVDLTE